MIYKLESFKPDGNFVVETANYYTSAEVVNQHIQQWVEMYKQDCALQFTEDKKVIVLIKDNAIYRSLKLTEIELTITFPFINPRE